VASLDDLLRLPLGSRGRVVGVDENNSATGYSTEAAGNDNNTAAARRDNSVAMAPHNDSQVARRRW
jgi:hypothetical protein